MIFQSSAHKSTIVPELVAWVVSLILAVAEAAASAGLVLFTVPAEPADPAVTVAGK
jgi:hypothetical protein